MEQNIVAELKKLSADLGEDAEWVGDNNYEVPIMLYDHLLMASKAVGQYAALIENSASMADTEKRIAAKMHELDVALNLACIHLEEIGGCKNMTKFEMCDGDFSNPEAKNVCAKCIRKTFLEKAAESIRGAEAEMWGLLE